MADVSYEEHESYGLLSLSRAQTKNEPLFGSSIEHSSIVILEIKAARQDRDLSIDWMYGGSNIVRVIMSPSQFADAITNLNNGSGTPVTIEYVIGDNKVCREKPLPSQTRKKFESDYSKSVANILQELDNLLQTPRLSVKTKNDIERIKTRVKSSIPHIEEQFERQMDKTVTEAKADIEAFMTLRERGIVEYVLNNAEYNNALEQSGNDKE